MSPVADIYPQKPTQITLLGMRLVIWHSKSSEKYQVFFDRCPHRLAPLSEGRIDEDTGNLMCSYHGWQFDDRGICTRIPQAENPELVKKNQQNFCTVVFPTQEVQDLLWVWPDARSADLAAQTPLPLSDQIDASKGFVWSSFVRDLEYDWQTLVENVADPSHVPFTHHGIQGDRTKAAPIEMKIIQSTARVIAVETDRRFNTRITFVPPCSLEYEIYFSPEKQIGLVTYCLPVLPGKSRIVAQFPRNFALTLHKIVPRWWDHINNRNMVLDGDMIILHQQERFLQQQQESWKTAYRMPTQADRLIIEFRKWFDRYCHGQLPWQEVGIVSPEMLPINEDRKLLLDRYEQHTRHCSSCRGALKAVQRWQKFLLVYFALTVAAVALMPDSMKLPLGLPGILTALFGLGLYSWLKFWLEPRFYFVDYVHPDRK